MSDAALAWIDTDNPARLRWRAASGHWTTGSYGEFAGTLAGRHSMLLLDGSLVTLLLAELPVGDARTARQALPYAVEERLAQPLEHVRLAHVPLATGRFLVAAIARPLFEAVSKALADGGLRPRLVAPEFCALPRAEAGWTIVLDGGMATVRAAEHAGIKIEQAALATVIAQLRREFPLTQRIDVYAQAAANETFPHSACAGLTVDWHEPLADDLALATLAEAAPLSLVDTVRDPKLALRSARLWGAVAACALLLVLGWPALLAWQNHQQQGAVSVLNAANSAVFKATFPGITRIVNARVQADQALATMRAQVSPPSRFLELLARIDAVSAERFPPGTRVAQIAFTNGVFELAIETRDMNEIERVRAALIERGLGAEMLSAESATDKVVARVRVGEGS